MSLFAAGVVLFALLVASYSGRRFWLALASTAISMAAFVGFLFVAIAKEPSNIRAGMIWAAGKLPLVLDQQTADTIIKALEQIPAPVAVATTPSQVPAPEPVPAPSPCEAGQEADCATASSTANAASVSEAEPPSPPVTEPQSIQATATPTWPATKPEPKGSPGSPVVWFLDDQQAPASSSGPRGFAISGMNASDHPFEEVHAVLKPDGGHSELALALNVEGQRSEGIIPAGARFSLGLASAKEEQIGGAILSFRYRQDGQSRTSIVYLTPSMISRLANRG